MTWTAYLISPIDFGCHHLPSVEDIAAQFARAEASDERGHLPGAHASGRTFLEDFATARKLAVAVGWEGDYRSGHEPRVFWLPVDGHFTYGFTWKQENNGDTLIVSPQPLSWLDSLRLS